MDARVRPGNTDAVRGLVLALGGTLLVPIVVTVVTTDRTVVATTASVLGFVVGITTALMAFWALIGLTL